MRIAYCISGHGYGHGARSSVVLNALGTSHEVHIVSPLPRKWFAAHLSVPFEHHSAQLDVGLVQPDSFRIDFDATLKRLQAFELERDRLVDEEARRFRRLAIDRVLVDIPPLSCVAARRAGVRAALIANFTWDDIYDPLEAHRIGFARMARCAADDYAVAHRLYRLPFNTPMPALPRQDPMGLVARPSMMDRGEIRRRLGWGSERIALLSYGGMGLGDNAPLRWDISPGWRLIHVGGIAGDRRIGSGVTTINPLELKQRRLGYPELVKAADAVMTKPGYGITSECLANRTPMIYSDRGPFSEYPPLVEGIRRWIPNAYLPSERLRAGEVREALEAVADPVWPPETLPTLTSEEIRERLAGFLS